MLNTIEIDNTDACERCLSEYTAGLEQIDAWIKQLRDDRQKEWVKEWEHNYKPK